MGIVLPASRKPRRSLVTSLLSPLPPSSGVFPTVPPTRVGLRPGSPGRSSTIGGPDFALGRWILSAMPVDPLQATNGTRDRSRWVAHGSLGKGGSRQCYSYPGTVVIRGATWRGTYTSPSQPTLNTMTLCPSAPGSCLGRRLSTDLCDEPPPLLLPFSAGFG